MRQLMHRMLVGAGHDVTLCADGKEAIRLLEIGRVPDLVVTDLIMPEQEGMETIMIIHERFPAVKIIAMSGAPGYLASAVALGAHETLAKPFSASTLDAAIAAALAHEYVGS